MSFSQQFVNLTEILSTAASERIAALVGVKNYNDLVVSDSVALPSGVIDTVVVHGKEGITSDDALDVRGVIIADASSDPDFDRRSPHIVADCFPRTTDIATRDNSILGSIMSRVPTGGRLRITLAPEGTIVRYWRDTAAGGGGKWILSSMRRINADRSKWDGPTFGEMFRRVMPTHIPEMDEDTCYIFLLRDPAAHIVCRRPTRSELVYLGSSKFDPRTKRVSWSFNKFAEDVADVDGIVDAEVLDLKTPEEVAEYANGLNAEAITTTGVLVTVLNSDGRPVEAVKVEAPKYRAAVEFRGGEPNLRLLYLKYFRQRRGGECRAMLPDDVAVFDKVDTDLKSLMSTLTMRYVNWNTRNDRSWTPKVWLDIIMSANRFRDLGDNSEEKIRRALALIEADELNRALNMLDATKFDRARAEWVAKFGTR